MIAFWRAVIEAVPTYTYLITNLTLITIAQENAQPQFLPITARGGVQGSNLRTICFPKFIFPNFCVYGGVYRKGHLMEHNSRKLIKKLQA